FAESWDSQHQFRWLLVDAADFEILFNPNFREKSGEMLRPVFHRCALTVMALGQELAEANTGHVNPPTMTNDEIHGDVEGILRIIFETGMFRKSKGEKSRTPAVGVSPDMTTHGEKTV